MQKYIDTVAVKNGARQLTPLVGGLVTVTTLEGAAAEIFDANGGLPRSSPLLTDINGAFSFYAVDGRYTITITGNGIVPITISDVLLEDPVDGAFVIVDGAIVEAKIGAGAVTTPKIIDGAVTDAKVAVGAAIDSTKLSFTATGAGAVSRDVRSKFRDMESVKDYGAVGDGSDESTKAAAMITAKNRLYVPAGFTLTCKNIELAANTEVIVDGALKMPAACADFDRLIYATAKSGLVIKIKEIDGNYAGQAGIIGTHLVYLRNCNDVELDVGYMHDHYVSSGAPMPAVDGTRDASSGAVLLYRCHRANVDIGLLSGWGREGIYLQECNYAAVALGHAQGVYNTEYSGLQVKGDYNRVTRASVDFAGASAVGFDTRYGSLCNVIATNTRENHGVNFGHTGFPATGSVASNIIVDGAFGFGIAVAAGSQDVSIDNFNISNAGQYGISFSDGVVRGKLSNGFVGYSALGSLNSNGTRVQTSNVLSTDLDGKTLNVNTTSGLYAEGETVSTATGSATVRRAIRNLSGALQIVFLTGITGTFSNAQALTGGTSGATGVITSANTPTQRSETGGGLYEDEIRSFPGTFEQVRFPDGTATIDGTVAFNHTTAGTIETFTQAYSSNVIWAATPTTTATVGSVSSTSNFDLNSFRVTATATDISIHLKASVNQIYGINFHQKGRWK